LKNSFIIEYATQLWLASIGVSGVPGMILGKIVAFALGDMADRGIIIIDLTIDKLKQALKEPQWREAAQKAYENAAARVYTEDEKNAIRQQYMDALRNFAVFGNGVRDDKNPKR
jgi:hypothetical protein